MKLLTSILTLTALAGVSAVPMSNSAATNTVTSGEFTYNGEGVVPVALPHPMRIVILGNANARGTMAAGLAKVDACSASRDLALGLAGLDLGIASR
ncbi:hypothetical protein ABOM_009000 [Aspergillus bombycis]|uniref:Uncharacterized protein n=1 Tax=Aspergillus bombycis TaxID=109264 RepID=A0A1F7ZTL3_9EURO|nr:hypothetical protein ABOM_009000 [Aspergillus bombycis]OGM42790.1 hypothetical protein ABOM_009000 [Aspergillus bombycis]